MLQDEHSPDFSCKVVVLGMPGSGKSTFIESFVKGKEFNPRMSYFPIFQTKILRDIGPQGKAYGVNVRTMMTQIWDSTNNETYTNVNRIYYRDANILTILYDAAKASSSEDAQNFVVKNLEGWYKELSEHVGECTGRD